MLVEINNYLKNDRSVFDIFDKDEKIRSTSDLDDVFVSNQTFKEYTGEIFELKGAISNPKEKIPSEVDEFIFKKVLDEKDQYKQIAEEKTKEMLLTLKYTSLEDDDSYRAEQMAMKIENEFSLELLGTVLQNIYIKYNDYINILVGICKILSKYEYNEVMPWGPTMLTGLLSHKNEIVKEYAVEVVDNWSNIEMVSVLKNLDCSSKWLQDYICDVVNSVEGKTCII